MEDPQLLTERIEAYLDGLLTAEEQAHFEARLAQDEALAAEVHLHRDTRALLRLHQQQVYKAQLQAIDQELSVPVRRLRPATWAWSLAAVILLLVVSSYFWAAATYRTDALVRDAFSPYRDITVLRGDYPGRDSLLTEAMAAYGTGDFATAVARFEPLLQMSPDYAIAQLYMGISLLGTDEPVRSQHWLRKAAASERLAEVAGWYLGLALVQAGDIEAARTHLQGLAQDPNNSYAPQAKALLRRLKSPLRRLPGID